MKVELEETAKRLAQLEKELGTAKQLLT